MEELRGLARHSFRSGRLAIVTDPESDGRASDFEGLQLGGYTLLERINPFDPQPVYDIPYPHLLRRINRIQNTRNPTPRASKVSKSRPSLAKADRALRWLEIFFPRSRLRAQCVCIADTQAGPRCT
jgi:hypothetical protein